MPTASLTGLEALLEALEADGPAVAYSLRRTAEALRGEGELRVGGVAAAIEDFTERCRRSEAATASQLAECGVPRLAGQRLGSVFSQRKVWTWLVGTESVRRLVQRLDGLTSDDPSLDLGPIQRQAELIRRTLAEATSAESLPADLQGEQLAAHPLSALVRLVGDDLTDNAWDQCQERVRGAFGPRVAVAAARGRLSCS